MKTYRFYGWEHADIRDARGLTPRDYYDLLSEIWQADTCAPRMRSRWSPENRTLGQCSITAFLMQDLYGGKVFGVPLGDGGFHCFNAVGGCVFDLTSEQFGSAALDYDGCPEQFREVHFAKAEKKQRYALLKARLEERMMETPAAREDAEPALSFEEAAAAIPPGRYRHFKGNEYEVLTIARHSETAEPMVVYRALYGEGGVWVRPASMWNETVERDGRRFKRFERVGKES